MSAPAKFLNALARGLAAMGLYKEGHPQRERAIDSAFDALLELQSATSRPLFTFLGDEVVYGKMPLREMRGWDWSGRLSSAGIQRLEFLGPVSREEFGGFLSRVLERVSLVAVDTSETMQMLHTNIRFGAVGIRDLQDENQAQPDADAGRPLSFGLDEEVEAVQWLHGEVQERDAIPIAEAESVVRSLAVAMHGGRAMMLPLLQLKEFDQYTTTHSLNVSVLAMGLAESLGLGASDVREFGVAGLLHDVGKIRIPKDLLVKPGALSEDEREVIRTHPVHGARLILETDQALDLAAIVAYEHHIRLNMQGYPHLHYARACHRASDLVHVCDVFDALRTNRPYRDAWPVQQVLAYIKAGAGQEFDVSLVQTFVRMIETSESATGVMNEAGTTVAVQGAEVS